MELSPLHSNTPGTVRGNDENMSVNNADREGLSVLHPLAAWLQSNSKTRKQKLEIFTDESGIRRYKHNWQIISEEDGFLCDGDVPSYNAHLNRCGMSSVQWKAKSGGDDVTSSTGLTEVLFIDDYVKTFNSVSSDRAEVFGRHAALFEITVMFLCDERTINLSTYTLIYCCCVFVLVTIVDPRRTQILDCIAEILILVAEYVGYRTCTSVYKATVKSSLFAGYEPLPTATATRWAPVAISSSFGGGEADSSPPVLMVLRDNDGRVPLTHLLRTYFSFLGAEAGHLFGCGRSNSGVSVAGGHRRQGSELSNQANAAAADESIVSERALLVEGGTDAQLGGCTNQCAYYLLLNVGVNLLDRCTLFETSMGHAGAYYIIFFFVYLVVMYTATVLLSVMNMPCVFDAHNDLPGAYSCPAEYLYAAMMLFNIIPSVFSVVLCMGMVVSITGLYYGSMVVHGLATSWVQRYSTLRKYRPLGDAGTDIFIDVGGENISVSDLEARIQTDAYEHYLMLREYVAQLSSLWSGIVLVLLVVGMGLVIFAFFCLIIYSNSALRGTLAMFGLFFVVLTQLAISCFAWANSAVDTIRRALRDSSSSSDYAVLGGREEWIAYLEDSPAHWTIYGFAITWNVLYAYASSGLTAMVGIATFAITHE